MSSSLNETNLERKFQGVTNTQDSIQTLSLWLLHHKAHHKRIVSTWMRVLKKAKISQRLVLFYLANDVIQNSKRKGIPFFKESFAEVLREATLFVRDEHIRNNIKRVFNIWSERSIYDSDFISDLQGILANAKVPGTAPLKALAEFKCENVIDKLKAVSKIKQEVSTKTATLNVSKLNATNSEILQKLKDKNHGQQFSREFDDSVKCLEELIKALNKEMEERNELIILLEQSEIYYDTQRGEAKIVSNAYKNFSSRVSAVQKKLKEMMPGFGSPLPSPTVDAPSPTNSDMELELPGESATSAEEEAADKIVVVASVPEMSAPAATISFVPSLTTCVGNPIPTLSNLFPQANQGKTASWFSSLAKPKPPVATTMSGVPPPMNDSSSLDSRLSSLFQNIPNLPSGLHDTLLGASTTDSNSQNSVPNRRSTSSMYDVSKDDLSGQNTPLQDEESPSTGASFFTRLASAPKSSQSPQDILKGLTSLIQTATKDKTQKPGSWPQGSSSPYETPSNRLDVLSSNPMSTESIMEQSSSSSVFYTSAAIMGGNTSVNSMSSLSGFTATQTTTLASPYVPARDSLNAQNVQGSLSYIPSIVPSAPKTTHFGYQSNSGFEEYDPCSANFKEDNDANSIGGHSNPTPLSESPSSPDEVLSGEELEDNMKISRQSTLITLVSNTPSGTPVSEEKIDPMLENTLPSVSQAPMWKNPVESVKPLNPVLFGDSRKISSVFQVSEGNTTDNGCPIMLEPGFSLEEDAHSSWQPSKIETVQSPRTRNPADNRWYPSDTGNYRPTPELSQDYYHPDIESYSTGPVVHNYHHQSPPSHMNSWRGRERPFGNNYNRGPMRKNFSQFSPRGRGRLAGRRFRPPLY